MTVVGTGAKRVRCSAGWVTGAHPSTRSLAAALEDKQPRWLTGFACCAVTDKKGKVHMEPVQRWLVRGKPERAVKNSKHHRIAREGKLRWECVTSSVYQAVRRWSSLRESLLSCRVVGGRYAPDPSDVPAPQLGLPGS